MLRPHRRTWHRPLWGTGHEIFEWRPFLWSYRNGSMVKDTELLGIHNLFPCLLWLFQPTMGQVPVCESAVFWDFKFFTSSLLLQNSALTAASHHLSLHPSPVYLSMLPLYMLIFPLNHPLQSCNILSAAVQVDPAYPGLLPLCHSPPLLANTELV